MTGTFASFNSALTALRYTQIASDVASNNIANANTEGYTKKRVVATEGTGTVRPAMWAVNDGTTNFGVTVDSIDRTSDDVLAARSRQEHATDSYLSTSSDVLGRVEDGIGEPSDTGLAKTLSDFRSSWSTLSNSPNNDAALANVLSNAKKVAATISSQAAGVQSEAATDRTAVLSTVKQVNTVSAALADVNRTLRSAGSSDVNTTDLEDKRDGLLKQLSELTGATSTLNADGTATVTLGGSTLVSGANAGTLAVGSGINPDGSSDGSSVSFSLTDTAGSTSTVAVTGTASGQLGALADALNTTIPHYLSSLDSVASGLADSVNSALAGGYDKSGTAGTAMFTYTAGSAASSLSVSITDASTLAANGTAGTLDGSVAASLSKLTTADNAYGALVSDFASTVSTTKTLSTNQGVLTSSIDDKLASVTGVDSNEELVNLTVAQHQYAAAARVITTLDTMLESLLAMGA